MIYHPQTPIAVFVGPSLARAYACQLLTANYYPPIRMGDIYRLLGSGVRSIVLIDGVFHRETSSWQREILEALDNNITVIGAASMGALRAAELHEFGMVGHGIVFAWYREGIIAGDDEVALQHADESGDFRPFSEPLVNIRYTIMQAVKQGCISQAQGADLIEYAQSTYYADRSYPSLLNSPIVRNWPQNAQEQLQRFIRGQAVNVKRQDAINALKYCATLVKGEDDRANTFPPVRHQGRYYQSVRYQRRGFLHPAGYLVPGAALLAKVAQDTGLVETLRPKLIQEHFLRVWCEQQTIRCPPDYLASYPQQWKNDHIDIDEDQWLRTNGLTEREFQAALAERALLTWLSAQGPAFLGLDFGSYSQLLEMLLSLSAGREDEAMALQCIETKVDQRARLFRQLSDICYLAAWASDNGIACPPDYIEKFIRKWEENYQVSDRSACLQTNGLHEKIYLAVLAQWACSSWLIQKGPAYFGYTSWCFEVALMQELQISGQAAQIVMRMAPHEFEE